VSRGIVAAKRTRAARAIVNRALEYARAGSTDPSHRARFDVHDPQVYERVLRKGSIGLGESYADGWWDTDNLAGFLRLALHGLQPLHDRQDRVHRALSPIIDPIARLHRADPARDVRNVRAHYDIGNEFFRRILDDTMAYSCAVFDTPTATLADASRTKFDRIARMARLAPGDRLLEIGTGWGGFALQLGTLVTIANAQPLNYLYIIMHNKFYETSGNQPIPGADRADLAALAIAAGFPSAYRVSDPLELARRMPEFIAADGPTMLVLDIDRAEAATVWPSLSMAGQMENLRIRATVAT
jgi:hypothetical protein